MLAHGYDSLRMSFLLKFVELLRGDPSCCKGCAAACPATCVCAMVGGQLDELKTLTSLQEYLLEDTGCLQLQICPCKKAQKSTSKDLCVCTYVWCLLNVF